MQHTNSETINPEDIWQESLEGGSAHHKAAQGIFTSKELHKHNSLHSKFVSLLHTSLFAPSFHTLTLTFYITSHFSIQLLYHYWYNTSSYTSCFHIVILQVLYH